VLPLLGGLGGGRLTDPAALGPTYRADMRICAAMLALSAGLAFAFIPRRGRRAPAKERPPLPSGADTRLED